MTAPVRTRGRRVARRGSVTQDVSFTLLQLHRPRRDDLRFGLFLFGDALHDLPVEEAPKPAADQDDDQSPPTAAKPDQQDDPPADDRPSQIAEAKADAAQPAESAAPQHSYTAPHDHYGAVEEFHADLIAIAEAPRVVDLSPQTVVSDNPPESIAATAPSEGDESPASETPTVAPPSVEVPSVETPTETAETPVDVGTSTGGTVPTDDGGEVPEPQQLPGIYICVEQDVTGGTDSILSTEVLGDYSHSSSGTSDPTLTTYQVIYLADTPEADAVADSVWAAGWQQVILSFQIEDNQSWTQTATVTVDQAGDGTGIDVDAEQLTWILEKGAIFISAHAENSSLYVDTTATLFTEINQITNVSVRVGTVSLWSEDAEESDAAHSTDIDIVQHVWIEQDVSVSVDVESGLDLSLDALLGQVGTVLQDIDLSVDIKGEELTLNLCADQEADIRQTVSVLLEVDEPVAESRDDSSAVSSVEPSDDDLGTLLESSFAAGDDLAFDDAYDAWAADAVAGDTETPETGPTTASVIAAETIAEAEMDVDPDSDFDTADDHKHYAAA